MKTIFHCRNCGYDWVVHNLGPDFSRYCPQCGRKELEKSYENGYGTEEEDGEYILTEEAWETIFAD